MSTVPRIARVGSPEAALVSTTVEAFIRPLQHGYREDHSAAVATLARLRRGAGRRAHEVPDLWGVTGLDDLLERLDAPEWEEAKGVNLTWAEEALQLAVTLWALHQQSHRDMDMHVSGYGLGRAVRTLMSAKVRSGQVASQQAAGDTASPPPSALEMNEPLRRRFVRVSTAAALPALGERLREIVMLLRGADIPLDYARLAGEIYRWQSPAGRAEVHRSWGRDFHLARPRGDRSRAETPAPSGSDR